MRFIKQLILIAFFVNSCVSLGFASITQGELSFAKTMDLFRSTMQVFSDEKGHYLIQAESFAEKPGNKKESTRNQAYLKEHFFWCHGFTCYQLEEQGFSGNVKEFQMEFVDTRLKGEYGKNGLFRKEENIRIKCDEKESIYSLVKPNIQKQIQKKAQFIPVPEFHRIEYLGRLREGGEIIFVDAHGGMNGYYEYRFFMGKPGNLQEYKITNKRQVQTEGMIILRTEKGEFLFPKGNNLSLQNQQQAILTNPEVGEKDLVDSLMQEQQMDKDRFFEKLPSWIGTTLAKQQRVPVFHTPCDPFFSPK